MTKEIYKEFAIIFSQETAGREASREAIAEVESKLGYVFPASYKEYVLEYGATFVPDILDLVVEQELDLPDMQEFVLISELVSANEMYWSGGMPKGYVSFASDSMGNMFCFLRSEESTDQIHFFDHDFCEVTDLEVSLVELFKLYIVAKNA